MTQPTLPLHPASPGEGEPQPNDGEINVLRIIGVVLRHVWLIVGVAMVLAIFALISGLSSAHVYSADASFIVEGVRSTSVASAAAAQLGIGGMPADGGQSAQFYIDLLSTRGVLRNVVIGTYNVRTDSGEVSGDLISILKVKGKTPTLREDAAKAMLRRMVSASVSTKTGVIKVTVTSGYPDLSSEILMKYLGEINKFNLAGRQSRASAERKFTEDRSTEAEMALTAAEDRLEEFLGANRAIQSPSQTLQRERLTRKVVARQQIYTELAQAVEQAKIDEVRDTPAITVIEPPVPPIAPNPRGTIPKTIKNFVFGLLVGTFLSFILDFLKRSGSRDPDAIQELMLMSREALRNPLRRSSPVVRD